MIDPCQTIVVIVLARELVGDNTGLGVPCRSILHAFDYVRKKTTFLLGKEKMIS